MFHNNANRVLRTLSHSLRRNNLSQTKSHTGSISSFFHSTTQHNSNAKLIQQLRKTTGAPMVECKKAISDPEVNGDFDKATDWLRKHGSAKMTSKLAGRDASEGLVGIAMGNNDTIASIVRVSSETDFASRSPDFSNLVETIANASLKLGGTEDVSIDQLKETDNVQLALDDAIISIRENLQIASASTITASTPNSIITGYVHGKVFNDKSAGTAAAIVELAPIGSDDSKSKEEVIEIGKKLAMHIVAAKPTYLDPSSIPDDIINKEKAVLLDQMADSGKPANILDKIVTGRLGKFYSGVCLLEQNHMLEEGNPKVSKFLKGCGLELISYENISIQ